MKIHDENDLRLKTCISILKSLVEQLTKGIDANIHVYKANIFGQIT